MKRRRFFEKLSALGLFSVFLGGTGKKAVAQTPQGYKSEEHYYEMGIQIDKCIGCGMCMDACKLENEVPKAPFFFRTWVERYIMRKNGNVEVQTVNPSQRKQEMGQDKDLLRSFFAPKLCNQCDHPPCVQVCPVGATFKTQDGVILVDDDRCIGCRYCIQACPYGARYLHPERMTADKCTFCYHRITKDLLPACVEVCPTQARIFGDRKSGANPLTRFKRLNKLNVLKPHLNTEPKVYYSNLDGEVR